MPIEVSAGYRLDDRRPAVEVQSTISTSPGKRLHWLTPDEAREMAEDLRQAAGEVEDALRHAPQGEGEAPKVVTLCGSSRFVDVMAVVAWELEKRGHIVHSLHLLPAWYGPEDDHQAEAEGVAEQMDELHLRKIDRSDEVLVIDLYGYIGESTSREIEYAEQYDVPISYLSAREDLHDLRMPRRQPEPTLEGGGGDG